MFQTLSSLGKATALLAVVLAAASHACAQTSSLGHVPARTAYATQNTAAPSAFQIYPGDHLFQATMKISRYYQNVERSAPAAVYHPPAQHPSTQETATPVEVTVTEPEGKTEMVQIRGPDGQIRSFPLLGGRKAIKSRTIIVRPGQRLNLTVYGGRVTVMSK
jgi:hypothetical protein